MVTLAAIAYFGIGLAAAFNFDDWCKKEGELEHWGPWARFFSVIWLVPGWAPFAVVFLLALAVGAVKLPVDWRDGK